jgi:hypothetical protein
MKWGLADTLKGGWVGNRAGFDIWLIRKDRPARRKT